MIIFSNYNFFNFIAGLNLINDILDLSKVEAGRMEVELRPTRPHEVIQEVLAVLSVRAQEKSLALQFCTAGPIPEIIHSDALRLRQMLTNLIEHYSQHKLNLSTVPDDKLGDAYEYLIGMFADDAGKKGGEFYTPHQVVELLVEIINPKEGQSIYDIAQHYGLRLKAIEKLNKVYKGSEPKVGTKIRLKK